MDALSKGNQYQILSIIIFLVGSVAIGNDRHSFLLNVRKENWFHYFLGTSSVMLAMCLNGDLTGRFY